MLFQAKGSKYARALGLEEARYNKKASFSNGSKSKGPTEPDHGPTRPC